MKATHVEMQVTHTEVKVKYIVNIKKHHDHFMNSMNILISKIYAKFVRIDDPTKMPSPSMMTSSRHTHYLSPPPHTRSPIPLIKNAVSPVSSEKPAMHFIFKGNLKVIN